MHNKPIIDSSIAVFCNKKNPVSDSHDDIDSLLDEALKESFSASDPIAVFVAEPERPTEQKGHRIQGKISLKPENRNKKAFSS